MTLLKSQLGSKDRTIQQKDEEIYTLKQKKHEQDLQTEQYWEEINLLREQLRRLQEKVDDQKHSFIGDREFSDLGIDLRKQVTNELKSIKRSINLQGSTMGEEERGNLKKNLKFLNKKTSQFMTDLHQIMDQNFSIEQNLQLRTQSLMQDDDISSVFTPDDRRMVKQKSQPFPSFKDITKSEELTLSEQDIVSLQYFQQKIEAFLARQFQSFKEKLKSILLQMNFKDQQNQILVSKLEGVQEEVEIKMQDQKSLQQNSSPILAEILTSLQEIIRDFPLGEEENFSLDSESPNEELIQLMVRLERLLSKAGQQKPFEKREESSLHKLNQDLAEKLAKVSVKLGKIQKKAKEL